MKKLGKGLLLTICIILLELSSMTLFFLIPLNNFVSKKTLQNNIAELIQSELNMDHSSSILKDKLSPIYDSAYMLGLDDEIILEILKSKEMTEFTADITSSMAEYIITGKQQKFITEEEFLSLVSSAIDTISQQSTKKITEEEKQKILVNVKEISTPYLKEIENIDLFSASLSKEDQDAILFLQFLFSTKLKIGIIITLLLSFGGIIALEWEKQKWVKISAITILVASILSCFSTFLLTLINQFIFKNEIPVLFKLLNKFIVQSYIIAGSVLFLMIMVLILYKIFIVSKKN